MRATLSTAQQQNLWLTRTARIAEAWVEYPGVTTYRLVVDSENADDYRFQPGQFNMLYLPGVGESAISMSGDPDLPEAWIHTVRVAGNVTRTLAALQVGDTLGLRGPFGAGWPVELLTGRDVIIVSGGLGLAPLRPLIYYVRNHRAEFGKVWLIHGSRDPGSLLYPSEYDAWRNAGLDVQITVDRADEHWTGQIGVVTVLVDRLVLPRPAHTCLVTCGPEVMMKYAAASGLRLGIPAEQIWVSLERNMQCAAGLCGHCQLGPAFVCKDGPVLRYDRIRPYLFVESL